MTHPLRIVIALLAGIILLELSTLGTILILRTNITITLT